MSDTFFDEEKYKLEAFRSYHKYIDKSYDIFEKYIIMSTNGNKYTQDALDDLRDHRNIFKLLVKMQSIQEINTNIRVLKLAVIASCTLILHKENFNKQIKECIAIFTDFINIICDDF
jgi:hypothetical protein